MTAEQAEKLTAILRNVRAFEKARLDQYFDFAEAALFILVEREPARAATAVFGDATGRERRLINKTELSKRLGISTRTVSDLLTDGMPCVRLGKRVQFDYDDVVTWAKSVTAKAQRKNRLRMVG